MRWLLKGQFKLFREQAGFTLFEVLLAVAILAVISGGFLTALETNSRATGVLDEQTVGANLASAHLEAIKNTAYAVTYPNVGDNVTIPPQYSVNIDVKFSSDGSTWTDDYTAETLQKITVTVLHGGKSVLSACTYRCER